MTAGYSCDAFRNATDTQVTSQGMLKAKSQSILGARRECHCDSHDRARCPILSVDRLVAKEVVVVMENERRYRSYTKEQRDTPSQVPWYVSRPRVRVVRVVSTGGFKKCPRTACSDCERDHVVDTRILT